MFGGLGLAAVFTLFLTLAIYVMISGFSKPRSAETERLRDELAQAARTAAAGRRQR